MMRANPFVPKLIARGLRPISELAAGRPHGGRLRYLSGCKCFACRRSNSDYERLRASARAAGDWNGIIDASRARAHLRQLHRAGVGSRSVTAATDVSRSILQEIRAGSRPRIRARTERKILGVTRAQRGDASRVPAGKTWSLIRALIDEGYTKSALARELGYTTPAIQFRKDFVLARSEARVVALHRRLTS